MMAFGGATIALLFQMVELMNPGGIPNIMILIGTNNVSRGAMGVDDGVPFYYSLS